MRLHLPGGKPEAWQRSLDRFASVKRLTTRVTTVMQNADDSQYVLAWANPIIDAVGTVSEES